MGSLCGKTEGQKDPVRILVLGISGSGKSTFSKQMKILYNEGFTDEERLSYVNIIRTNVLIGMKELAEQAVSQGLDVEEKHRKYVRYFKENNVNELELADQNVLKKVKALWSDDAIQSAWEKCRNYQIQVSQLDYVMDNLDRITENDYIPNDEDIIRSRQRTTGAYSTRFIYEKDSWEIFDVGGQIPERKKWKTIVNESNFTTIIYFAALDEYNMESNEAPGAGKTKMEVSLEVFSEIVNDEETFGCCRILFLNKTDLFREKIKSKDGLKEFKDKFPDFEDYLKEDLENDIQPKNYINEMVSNSNYLENNKEKTFWGAIKYIERKFRNAIENEDQREQMLVAYPTCAIDKDLIEKIFHVVKDYVFDIRMTLSGIHW